MLSKLLPVVLLFLGHAALAKDIYKYKGPNNTYIYSSSKLSAPYNLIKTITIEGQAEKRKRLELEQDESVNENRKRKITVKVLSEDDYGIPGRLNPDGSLPSDIYEVDDQELEEEKRKEIKPYNPRKKRPKVDSIINRNAIKYGVPAELVHAVIRVESNFDEKAKSPKGAMGYMQLMPKTAKRFGVIDITDPKQNIRGGTEYLRYLIDFFNQDISLALAGYNAGENAVVKYDYSIPPYKETQNYVKKVMKHYRLNQQQAKSAAERTVVAKK